MSRITHESAPQALVSSVLVGRERELARLTAALNPPSVCVVEGEAGVGKTRLVTELLTGDEARGAQVLLGSCQQAREPFFLGAVVEALRGLRLPPGRNPGPVTGAARPLLPELADRLPPHPGPLPDRTAERHRLLRAVRELVKAAGRAVLVVEDLHWADEATREFVGGLLDDFPDDLALVTTFRREDLPPSPGLPASLTRPRRGIGWAHVTLDPLPPPDVRSMVAAILRTDAVSEDFARFLHERTGGLPLAVEEVLRLLQERGDIVTRDGRWERRDLAYVEVPPAVRDLMLERLDKLTPEGRAVTRAAAVLGRTSPERTIITVARLAPERGRWGIGDALDRGMLVEVGAGYALRHPLAEEAVVQSIAAPQRRRLHLRAAETLQDEDSTAPATLAHHYRLAEATSEWVRCAEAAADDALGLGDDLGAYRLLEGTLDVDGLVPATRARIAVKLAHSALDGLEHARALEVLAQALAEPIPREERGELRVRRGWLLFQAGDAEAAFTEIREVIEELGSARGLRARAMATLAIPWVRQGSLTEHLAWMDRAEREAEGHDDPVVRAAMAADRAYLLEYVGDPDAEVFSRALEGIAGSLEARRHAVRGLLNVSHAACWVGHDHRARHALTRAREIGDETSSARLLAGLEGARLPLDWNAGEWQGLQVLSQRLRSELAVPHALLDVEVVTGLHLAAAGKTEAAERHLRGGVDLGWRTGIFAVLAAAASGLAELRLLGPDPQAAWAELEAVLAVIEGKGIWAWAGDALPTGVRALLDAGRGDDAARLVTVARRQLKRRDAPAASAGLLTARGWLAAGDEPREAARLFVASARAWEALPRPYPGARAREAAGRQLLDAGDSSGGSELQDALAAFVSLGAVRDANRTRAVLRRHGIATPHRRGRKGYGSRLSPREREVALLAAEGRTNREIAETLFLSRWTVSDHVARAVRKLGLASRVELSTDLVTHAE